jgi:hypothetical protein
MPHVSAAEALLAKPAAAAAAKKDRAQFAAEKRRDGAAQPID